MILIIAFNNYFYENFCSATILCTCQIPIVCLLLQSVVGACNKSSRHELGCWVSFDVRSESGEVKPERMDAAQLESFMMMIKMGYARAKNHSRNLYLHIFSLY